jgi:2-succinyl-5-enolpyruvyl-6-hydroxy-3-cyclohexene-1-carboxylate synthase
MMADEHAVSVYIGAFVDELARAGLRHVCIAPGSRSTPLALTIAKHPALKSWMHLDERSAAFFALGMARALNAPVALLCTSGTAGANFFPAVIEARAASVPLLVFTADRPPELRDVGAAQTIDQNRLYGNYPKWFTEVALPESTPDMLRYIRTLACRAVATAGATPAGPVHLNFPFREPLTPVPLDAPAAMTDADALAWHGRANGAPWVAVVDQHSATPPATVRDVASRLRGARRPLLVCGPQYDPDLAVPFAALAAALDAPLLVDPLSQLRWGPHDRCALIDRYDAVLRDGSPALDLVPDVILRIGALPTSKALLRYLEQNPTAHQIVVDAALWPDPTLLAAQMIHAEPRLFCAEVLAHLARTPHADPNHAEWLATWRRIDARAGSAIAKYVAELDENFEGAALARIAALVPDHGTIFVSSSMPVRDLDTFAAGDNRSLRILANRGANGIDGVVSSALGAAATIDPESGPLVLVLGDIAMYHDMNGLLAARLHRLNATIVVLNNDGGGIFSFLPQAAQPAHFEQLFGTPHGLRFEPVAKLYGATYHSADSIDSLCEALIVGMTGDGLHIIEMRTDRARNVQLHRNAWTQAASAIATAE